MRQPLPRIALGDFRLCRQLARRHRPICIQRFVEPEPVTNAHQGYTKGTAEIAEYAHEAGIWKVLQPYVEAMIANA